ncbi:MAG: CDP-glycerol glycerophosphotransferase family protein [Clostridia bacterium]|nr:CDP-glycerol glycerophosphotransferase family protein [Clostridia bacterium]
MSIKVSVIAAVHNGGAGIKKTLDCVKNQSLKEIEVIMVDALSDDCTAEIMKSYTQDRRFVFRSSDSESISESRNFALSMAKGTYVAFCDSNVIFTENLLREMYEAAREKDADLCVSPMASTDIYGKHEFSSATILSREKVTDRFDTNLIWNPAVTNKLFKREKLTSVSAHFSPYGKAREAAFSIPFALESNIIVSCSKGSAVYINPVNNEGVSVFPVEQYLDAYEYIISKAEAAFDREAEKAESDFDKKELKKQKICYIDQIYHKEITVLLYSYYRHFWALDDERIKKYADIIRSLYDKLSKSGKSQLRKKNKDIFYGEELITSKKELSEKPKVTLCISAPQDEAESARENLGVLVESVYNQTMPSFELFADESLYDLFPEKYKSCENLTFIKSDSVADFRDNCLDMCHTDYIMFQECGVRLNPKILMRHYTLLEGRDKYGFSTSPITLFDGVNTGKYVFSDLFFRSQSDKSRIQPEDKTFLLDLFFCNKLFSVTHLKGIHFSFSDNPVHDMYKLYKHSRFKKLSHRGAYLNVREEEAVAYLRREEKLLDERKRKIFRNYKLSYLKSVQLKNVREKTRDRFSASVKYIYTLVDLIFTFIFSSLKLQDRVFFYTGRATGEPDENLRQLYRGCRERKVLFAKEKPHGFGDLIKKRYYLFTSRVIVTDDYIYHLRKHKLKNEQKLIQIWYTGGALKKMGIDGPSILSDFDEYKTHSQYSDFCVSSEYVRQYYCHAFGLEAEVVKAVGTPRSDLVINEDIIASNRAEICSKHPLLRNKRVYLYCPTVRIKEDVAVPFSPKIDWAELNDELEDDEVFIICRHPAMKEEYIKGRFYSRVKDYTFESTSELLAVADVIITDYSSVVFDASLMDKPTVFYCPDYEEHKDDTYLDYEKDLPGEMIMKASEILPAIRRADEVSSPEVRAVFKEKQMGACDGRSTERILGIIKNYMK